jgi:segregation and condensation protein B
MKKKAENSKMGEIEALLFVAGEPVATEKIRSFLKITKKKWSEEMALLNEKYSRSDSGLQIMEKGSKIQLVSKPKFAEEVAKFLGKAFNEELSRATLETLAVVAYRGPVTRAQIEHIRGVNCSFALRTLSLRGIVERKENPLDSRSYLYEVSFEFLKGLGLKSVRELKDYEKLKEMLVVEDDTGGDVGEEKK